MVNNGFWQFFQILLQILYPQHAFGQHAFKLFIEFQEKSKGLPLEKLAVQFSDSYRKAIPNLMIAILNGIKVIDTSTGGAGYNWVKGAPYTIMGCMNN